MTTITHTRFQPNTEGIFNIPAELYHNHILAPEVSRSLVVEMAETSPAHVKAKLDGIAKTKVTKAMVSGTVADMAILEPEKFIEGVSHYVIPAGIKLTTKEGIQWKKDHPLELPTIPEESDNPAVASLADIRGMIESVMADLTARRIVESSVKQESAFCFHPPSGILRKCRPDARLIDNNRVLTLADLKTTFYGGTTDRALSVSCSSHAYFVQSPFYSDIYKDLLGEEPYFIFFVVERKPPYVVRVFNIEPAGIEAGRILYTKSLERFAQCKASGNWNAWGNKIATIKMQRWVTNGSVNAL